MESKKRNKIWRFILSVLTGGILNKLKEKDTKVLSVLVTCFLLLGLGLIGCEHLYDQKTIEIKKMKDSIEHARALYIEQAAQIDKMRLESEVKTKVKEMGLKPLQQLAEIIVKPKN